MRKLIVALGLLVSTVAFANPGSPYLSFGWVPAAGGGTPAYDNSVAVRGTVGGGNTTITQAFACTGSCTSITGQVFINNLTSAVPTITATYNGVSLTVSHTNACAQNSENVVMYTFNSTATPASGTNNIVVTASSAPAQEFSMTAESQTGTTVASPIHTFGTDVCTTTADTTLSDIVTSATGELVTDSFYISNGNGGALTTNAPATQTAKWGTGGTQGVTAYQAGASGTVTTTHAGSFGNHYAVGTAISVH